VPATITQPGANQPHDKNAPQLVVPFTRAAKEHLEAFVDLPVALSATSTQMGPYDVPAYGFMRHLIVTLDVTGGSGTATVVKAEDAPWSAIQEIALLDVNGAPIVGPISGYDLYLINKYGGYSYSSEPKQSPYFTDVAAGANGSGNFRFLLRLPIEVSARDGLGALPNQNAASTYKLRVTLAPASSIYTTPPTVLPTVRLRAHLEAWTQPTSTDLRGNSNAQQPPAVGSTSYWSKTIINVPSGQQTIRLPRVGNYIRHLAFVYRDAGGSRANGAGFFPDPSVTMWDTKILESLPRDVWKHYMQQRYDYVNAVEAARGLDNGVFIRDFAHDFDGGVGYELRDGWLPTVQSTRLEVQGNFSGAGVLTVLTNDVSPAGEIFV
jgi:hypothetical protein